MIKLNTIEYNPHIVKYCVLNLISRKQNTNACEIGIRVIILIVTIITWKHITLFKENV